MAKYERFEELPVWQDAARLYNAVLDLLEEEHCPLTLGFRNQLDRAALSPSNNIAEGFERASTKELVGYLVIARGSAGEVRSMISTVKNRQRLIELKEHFAVIVRLAESCTPDYCLDHLDRELSYQREAIPSASRNKRSSRRPMESAVPRLTLNLPPASAIGYLLLAMVLL